MSSQKHTIIEFPDKPGAQFMTRGPVSRDEAVAEALRYFEEQIAEHQQAIELIKSGAFTVWHQRGIYVARDRKEVTE
jgi:hypothetical protein